MDGKRVVPIILCGGTGTRLWPVSRDAMPKQFIPLIGDRSTFQQVLERTGSREMFSSPIVITSSDFRFIVAEQLRDLGIEAEIVLEPVRRDSGPAVAVAAELVSRRDPQAVILVLAADQIILDQEKFIATCRQAIPTADAGKIVIFGIRPSHASEDYGYILPGHKVSDMSPAHSVKEFAEKPGSQKAEQHVKDGYMWNSGNFMFRADVMLAEIARYEPEIASAAMDAVSEGTRDYDFFRLGDHAFERAPAKSIDFSVMERTSHAAVIPADYRWSNLGNWSAVWDLLSHDRDGNAVRGQAEFLNARGNMVHSEHGILTAVVGLSDLIVIATADAVLVASRAKSGDVKALVDLMRSKNRSEVLAHRRVYRPWGHYQTIDVGGRDHVKRIVVNPGATLSLQKHFHRAEHWVVVKGTAEVTVERDIRTLYENESIYVPIGSVHRLANRGRIPLELIEVQVGSYLGEDDIIRIEDVYNRN